MSHSKAIQSIFSQCLLVEVELDILVDLVELILYSASVRVLMRIQFHRVDCSVRARFGSKGTILKFTHYFRLFTLL